VPAISATDLVLPPPSEGSREVAARVSAARSLQSGRFAALGRPDLRVNSEAQGSVLEAIAPLDSIGLALLREAADAMRLSARGYHRVLKFARTVADLDGAETIGRAHLAEALAYRALHDRLAVAA
jgi:magnesium chelatase family protein